MSNCAHRRTQSEDARLAGVKVSLGCKELNEADKTESKNGVWPIFT